MNKWKLAKSYTKSIVGGSVGFISGVGVVYVTKPFYTIMDDPSNDFAAVLGLFLDGVLAVGVGIWGAQKGWKKGPSVTLQGTRNIINAFILNQKVAIRNHLQKRSDEQP